MTKHPLDGILGLYRNGEKDFEARIATGKTKWGVRDGYMYRTTDRSHMKKRSGQWKVTTEDRLRRIIDSHVGEGYILIKSQSEEKREQEENAQLARETMRRSKDAAIEALRLAQAARPNPHFNFSSFVSKL